MNGFPVFVMLPPAGAGPKDYSLVLVVQGDESVFWADYSNFEE
jgi:hypothetical protein